MVRNRGEQSAVFQQFDHHVQVEVNPQLPATDAGAL